MRQQFNSSTGMIRFQITTTHRIERLTHPNYFQRKISFTPTCHQKRARLRRNNPLTSISRPILDPDNPYLPSTAVVINKSEPITSSLEDSITQLPIVAPVAALDSKLARKLKNSPIQAAQNQISDPAIAQQVRRDGEAQLNQIVQDWVRNKLNVMGTIKEETIEIFMKLLLHPSTLAPLAEKLKLQTAGREEPVKPSGFIPKRLVQASTVADEELLQLLHYFIGTIYRSLCTRLDSESNRKFKKYVINLIQTGLTKDLIKHLLIRSSQLSGQDSIGDKKGFSKAEIRVAQLEIWGERRSRKIRKLVPEQIIHRTKLKSRKAEILKQRWLEEEFKMFHWRNRLMKITAFQQNEVEAERLRRLDHSNRVKEWRKERKGKILSSTTSFNSNSTTPTKIFSKMFNFWPFNSTSDSSSDSTSNRILQSTKSTTI